MKQLQIDLSWMDIIGHLVLWTVLIVVTLGIALVFYPYSFGKFFLNRIYILDRQKNQEAKLQCNLDITSQIGQIVIWLILIVLTGGILLPFYYYRVAKLIIDKTSVITMHDSPVPGTVINVR